MTCPLLTSLQHNTYGIDEWACEWMAWYQNRGKKKTNLACDSKQAYEAKVQAFINMWMGFKKGGKACETNQANNMRNLD